jgi:hypothetical protein
VSAAFPNTRFNKRAQLMRNVNYGTSFAGMIGSNHKLPWAAVKRFHLTWDLA